MRTVIALLCSLLAMNCGCSQPRDRGPDADVGIELDEPFRTVHGLTIENGSAFDQAAVDLEKYQKVILPDKATVRREGGGSKLQIFMRKTLKFAGHPPEPMSIRTARKNMGCAVKPEGTALVAATFGEWDSRIEGGANMRLVIVVTVGVEVEQRKGLSGPDSAGQERRGRYLTKPKDAKGGYWYGPASPTEDWTAVPDVPDPARTAK